MHRHITLPEIYARRIHVLVYSIYIYIKLLSTELTARRFYIGLFGLLLARGEGAEEVKVAVGSSQDIALDKMRLIRFGPRDRDIKYTHIKARETPLDTTHAISLIE